MNIDLPLGWEIAQGADLFLIIRGVTYQKQDALNEAAPNCVAVLRAGNLQNGRIIFDDLVFVPSNLVSEMQRLHAGDLVVAMSSGSASVVGKVASVQKDYADIAFGAFCGLLRPIKSSLAGWLSQYFQTKSYRNYVSSIAAGVNINNLRPAHLLELKIPLPPLNEQRRIVAKIEALKARSQQAKEALETIPPLLNQFRQSVLAAAFRGDLTADWREKNPDVEPASVLLERIRSGCRQNKAKGKDLEEIDLTTLPELPKSWCWASLGEVSAIQGGIQKQPKRVPNKNAHPFLRVANVPRGGLNLADVHQIELFNNELERLRLYKGDLLVVEGNGSPSEIGRMAIWDGSIKDCVHQNHLIRVRLNKELVPEFVEAYWNSPQGRFRVFDVAHTTTGLYTLSVSKIAKLPVPLAPEAEQIALIQILEKIFKIETYVQATTMQSEEKLYSLDQSILAKAFRGELVPQDPNDEPASVLLERIQAERANREAEAKAAKKSTGKTNGRRSRKAQQQDSESIQLDLPGVE